MKDFLKKNLSLVLAVIIFILGSVSSVIIGFAITGEGTPEQVKLTETNVGEDEDFSDDTPEWFDDSPKEDTSDKEVQNTDTNTANKGNGSTGVTENGVKTYRSRWDKILDEEGFIYGINAPWFGYHAQGAQFASNNFTGMGCRFNDQLVKADLYNLKALGFTSVNVWFVISEQGAIYDEKGYVTGLKDEYITNIKKVLDWSKELDLGLTITLNVHADGIAKNQGKQTYDKAMQYVTTASVRKSFMEKALKPVLDIIKEYEPWIVSFVAYCEPELDIYTESTGRYSFGTSQECINSFIDEVRDICKEKFPYIPVGLATLQYVAHNYNNLGLDYIGYDVYNNEGFVPDIEDQMSTTPMTLTEFACNDASISEATRAGLMYNMYESAKEKGYIGGWFWAYDVGTTDLVTAYTQSEFTLLTGVLYSLILDNRYEQAGIDPDEVIDKPVWLAYDKDKVKLYFMSSRQADTYTIERSTDGKNWTVIAKDIPMIDLDVYGNGVCEYKDLTREYLVDYYYRVTAKGDNGTVVSDNSAIINYELPLGAGPDNLVKDYSFESGVLSNQWVRVDPEYRLESGDSFGAEGTDTALVFSQTNQAWKLAVLELKVEPGKTYQAMVTEHSTNWAGEFQWFMETSIGKRDLYAYSNGTLISTSGWTQYFSDEFTVPAGVDTIYLTIQSRTHGAQDSKGSCLTIFDNIYVHEVTE